MTDFIPAYHATIGQYVAENGNLAEIKKIKATYDVRRVLHNCIKSTLMMLRSAN